jgi:hypothetical protein
MTSAPWYREPWPWLLMAGPAIVVVAGVATAVLAVTSFDGMVADDYYKQGLAINRTIARDANAKALGLSAWVQFSEDRARARVFLGGGPRPAALRLALVHATLTGEDQAVTLSQGAPGVYEGAMRAPRHGPLRLSLEDAEGRWRLGGDWSTNESSVRLAPR